MKKWMLIISIAFFMSLTACDNTDEPDNENKDEPNDPIESITISFETNGGSTLSALTLEEGSSLSEPNDPSKPGYTFRGWSTSRYALDPFDFDASLESNMTL
ncbi:MAG: InlB B-repeat-containing protein, partial [Bacillota bacterium]